MTDAAEELMRLVLARLQQVSDELSIVWSEKDRQNAEDVIDYAQNADLLVDELVEEVRRFVWVAQIEASR